MLNATREMIREEGFRGMYKGAADAAKRQSIQTAIYMLVMTQLNYFFKGNEDAGPEEDVELQPVEATGTSEKPQVWAFDEWAALNRSMAVKPVEDPNVEASITGDEEADEELRQIIEKWADLSEEEQAEVLRRYGVDPESQYAEAEVAPS